MTLAGFTIAVNQFILNNVASYELYANTGINTKHSVYKILCALARNAVFG